MPDKKRFAAVKISLSLIFLLSAAGSFSQDGQKIGGGYAASSQIEKVGYTTEIYDATNGLPTSDANFILGSSDGYVWIGGYSGIIRYNGSIFERLPTSFGLTSGRGFFEDSKSRIWIATNDNGVVVMDDKKTRHYTYKDGLSSSSIRIFAEDNDGNVFIGTTAGVSYVNPYGQLYTIYDDRINKERILKLDSDSNGRIYGQTKSGKVFAIDNCIITEFYTGEELGTGTITTLMRDPLNSGKVYLGTQGSAIYHGEFGKKAEEMEKIDVSPVSNTHWMSYDCERIWISSTTQIGYLDEKNQMRVLSNIPMNSSIEMTTSDYQGNIWAASATQGVMKIVTNNFVNFSRQAALPKETINATCLRDGNLYIGGDHGLKIIDNRNQSVKNSLTEFIGDTRIRCIIEDSKKNLWIATYTNNIGLVCYTADKKIIAFTTKNGMPSNQVRCLRETKSGEILAGTSEGLSIIKDGKIARTVTSKQGIKNSEFLTVEEGADKKIYAGSDGDGIYVIDGNKISRIGRDDGLTSDVVMRIKNDEKNGVLWLITSNSLQYIKDGEIKNVSSFPYNNNYDLYFNNRNECWVLSSYGIFNVNTEDLLSDSIKDYRSYTIANGLPCAITGNSFSAHTADGTLYIPGRECVVMVNIDHYFESNSQLKVDLNSIYCDDQKISPNQNGIFVLPASKGRIKLTPSVMDYTMTNSFIKVYLEGSKDAGITVRRNELSSLEYTDLAYGNYTLHIQVLGHNKTDVILDKAFGIVKKPRLTELFIFRILILALVIFAAGFIVWRVIKNTVISRQYAEITQAKDEAEQANSAKSRFLSNMSQEILTPINTILGMNEMIMREDARNVPKSYFMSVLNYAFDIKSAANSLFTLVTDLLELTKIESGKLQLSQQEYDLHALLTNIVSFIRVKTTEKEIKFEVIVDEMIPKRLYGDAGKIKQIVLKLLSNAVKNTDDGGIILKLTMESRKDNMCGLCFSVKDTGIGIDQEDVETLFSPYEHIAEDDDNENINNGLGLNISRKFAELMGGVLICKSNLGEGSEFIFALEQKIIDSKPIGVFNEQDDKMGKGPYIPQFIAPDADILVVDDNIMNLHVIQSLLKVTKVFVTTATSCEDCLAKIRSSSFNVVFLNKNIPGMDGEEAIQKIREYAPALPVYALTENSSSDEDYYKNQGFNGCLTIPIDSEIMERTIMRNLSEAMMSRPAKNDRMETVSELPEDLLWLNQVEGISVPLGIKNSGGISTFIFSLNFFLETIDDNIKSINRSYKNGDFKMYGEKARIIKTSAQYVGAEALLAFSAKMEEACKKDDRIFVAANTDKFLSEYTSFKEKLGRIGSIQGDAHNV